MRALRYGQRRSVEGGRHVLQHQPSFNHARPSADGRRHARRMSRVAEWVALIGVFLLTIEATCRLEDWIRFRTPFLSPVVSWMDLIVSDQHGIHGRPNTRFQKWVINDLGMRGPDAAVRKPPSTVRVLAAGASETFGLHESPGREFPRQLEDSLNAQLGSGQCRGNALRRFEVLNAALPGMSLPTIEQNLRARVRDLGVDIVVMYPTPTQYLKDDPPRPTRPNGLGLPPTPSAIRALKPRAIERVRSQAKEILPDFAKSSVQLWLRRREVSAQVGAKPPGWRFTAVPAERVAHYDRDLRRFIGAMRSTGAALVIATHANAFMRSNDQDPVWRAELESFYPRATGAVISAFDSIARPLTLRAAADSSATVIDLAARLSEHPPVTIFRDFLHFTDLGAARVAGALSPAVLTAARERGLCNAT